MKILHIGKYYHPFSGGMESVVKDLCEGLAEKGHDVTVLCSNTSMKYSEEVINGVKVIRLPRLGVFMGQNLNPHMLLMAHKLARKNDLVHIHSPNPAAELIGITLPKSIPLVSTHHSDIVRQKFLLKFYAPLFRKFLNRLRKVFVPTDNHITYSNFLTEYQNKCELIPFGIKDDFLRSNEENIKLATQARKEYGPYGLFVGRLVGYKGLNVLIEAAKKIDEKIIVVGTGIEEDNLKSLIKKNNLENKVILKGRVEDGNEFVGLYHGCEFLVLPSITPNENFGIVQLEAMACSKPVITTNLKSGVPAVGEKGKTCLIVEPGDVTQLANAMTMIFKNPDLKSTLGRCGRARFEELYTWQGMIDSQVGAYRNVLEISEIISKHGKKAA